MFKILALSVGIAALPLTQKTNGVQYNVPSTSYHWNSKNTIATNPFEAGKQTHQTPEPLQQGNWYANAMQHVEQSEYHFKWEEKLNVYCTPNRKQNLRFFYNENGFSVEPRITKIPLENDDATAKDAEKKYRYLPHWKIKFNLDKKQVGHGKWQIVNNKAAYITNNITVQYINNKKGMRQNFIVQKPLSNKDELYINFSIKSKLKSILNGNQIQFFHNKTNVLNYQDLKVWDGNNQPLKASIQKKNGSYYIQVNTINAVYPITIDPISTTPATILENNQSNSNMGVSVASAGDVNGDGYSDLIVGASQYDNGQNGEGRAFVYHGSATGINTTPAAIVESNQINAEMGRSVASAGDVNGDGYSDVIVGAFRYDNGEFDEGAAFVYHGSATGINTTAAAIVESNQADALMGSSVASAGDVNGDGYSDIIVGAYLYDNGENNEGAAFVYHGSAVGLSNTPNNTLDDANQIGAFFGWSVASAGDVNGDGYSDVIIGARSYDDGANTNEGRAFVYHGSATGLSATPNSTPDDADQIDAQFGISVAAAGDVNGDGYGDVIIGANTFDDGFTDEGRVFVYHGSATGLSATPSSTRSDADQASASFGWSVASAGDVNGDGYGDVIVAAPFYNDGANGVEGRAFVYHGSATGLSATPSSTPDDADQANAQLGVSVAGAGDVNGDGFSDVIIGASLYDDGANTNEGRAFVYHGSATGLSATPNSVLDDANQGDARFGVSVSSAGDVNGDGFSDVIIGASLYDDGFTDEGRAFVYHGSATGLSATPNNTPDDADQASARFGVSVASAGDVNGDGYSDVVIGANTYNDGANSGEGRAFVYHGSATGLSAIPNSTPDDADQANAAFGFSLASAGDVNGDGYSDVLVGCYAYDEVASSNEGRAFVYNGNDSTTNKRNNLRLYNADLTTPINSTNFIFSNFGAGLFAKSFLGRTKGKLVWETRLNFDPYSGTPITNSTFFTSQQSSYTDLGLAGTEMKNLVSKVLFGGRYTKIRARVKYDLVTAITGQVYGPWRNVSPIIDGNSLGALPLELISFNAVWLQKGSTARLNFVTDKESGVCCFDVEKSSDGFNFYSIGTLPAKNTGGIQSYSFIDGNATAKKQFYRIKIKDNAGKTGHSNMQELQNDKATEILVFPNPTTDVLHLQLNKAFDKMDVRIVNAAGQVVKQYQNLSTQNQILQIPVSQLASGNYWVHLQNGKDKQLLQFVKQ